MSRATSCIHVRDLNQPAFLVRAALPRIFRFSVLKPLVDASSRMALRSLALCDSDLILLPIISSPCNSTARSISLFTPSSLRLRNSSSSIVRPSCHEKTSPPSPVNFVSTASVGSMSSSRTTAERYPNARNAAARLNGRSASPPPQSTRAVPYAWMELWPWSIRFWSRPRRSPTSLAPSQTITDVARKASGYKRIVL